MDRTTRDCRICGRPIFWDHGFKARNFREHEMACAHRTDRQRVSQKASSARVRARGRRRRKNKKQLDLPFDKEPVDES